MGGSPPTFRPPFTRSSLTLDFLALLTGGMTTFDDVTVHTGPCSECGLTRTIGVEQVALAVVPASCPGRREVLVEVVATVLAGCPRCA